MSTLDIKEWEGLCHLQDWKNCHETHETLWNRTFPGIYNDIGKMKIKKVSKHLEEGWSPKEHGYLAFFITVANYEESQITLFELLRRALDDDIPLDIYDGLMEIASCGPSQKIMRHLFILQPNINEIQHSFFGVLNKAEFENMLKLRSRKVPIYWFRMFMYDRNYWGRYGRNDIRAEFMALLLKICIERDLVDFSEFMEVDLNHENNDDSDSDEIDRYCVEKTLYGFVYQADANRDTATLKTLLQVDDIVRNINLDKLTSVWFKQSILLRRTTLERDDLKRELEIIREELSQVLLETNLYDENDSTLEMTRKVLFMPDGLGFVTSKEHFSQNV